MSQGKKKIGDRDDRIIALLDRLGERMVRGEDSRRALEESVSQFDRVFASFESRAANSEKKFQTIQQKISRAEEIERSFKERQERLEKEQKIQAEKLERATALTVKMEEALAQQARLSQRLEKIINDRARMLHKLERIEAAVLETREVMNAGLLSLPPPQEMNGHAGRPRLPVAENQNKPQKAESGILPKAAAIVALLLILAAGGWAANVLYERRNPPAAMSAADITADDVAGVKADIMPAPPADPRAESPSEIAAAEDSDLIRQFNENPDDLAAALNDIEPGLSGNPEDMKETAAVQKPASAQEEARAEQVSLPPPGKKEEIKTADIDSFVDGEKDLGALEKRISRDSSLPPVVREIEQKAFEGIPEAQHDLAAIYTAGHGGVPVDYKKAAQWFHEAAINGVANARYNLGVLYQQGMGVGKNIDKAISWYRAAAKMGHPEAQYNLGIAYIEGIGTEYNPGQAAMYFEQAARAGITEAAYNLGLILENGLLGAGSPRDAVYWYKTAADKGSAEAKTALDNLARTMKLSPADIDRIVGEMDKQAIKAGPPPGKAEKTAKVSPSAAAAKKTTPLVVEDLNETETASLPAPVSAPGADGTMIAQIQEQLMRLGLYPGPADGIGGPQTEDAIRAYQARNGMKKDGRPSPDLLASLLATDIAEEGSAQP